MTMFNITDGNNNVSRDKPVEHIDIARPRPVRAKPWSAPARRAPLKRDCSVVNPNSAGDYSSCALEE